MSEIWGGAQTVPMYGKRRRQSARMIQEWNHTVRKMVGAHFIWPVEPPFKFIPTCIGYLLDRFIDGIPTATVFNWENKVDGKNSMIGPATNLMRPIWGTRAWHEAFNEPCLFTRSRVARSPAELIPSQPAPSTNPAALSATIMVGALMLPEVMLGKTEASTTRSAVTPRTCSWLLTTPSRPIAQLPHRW